MNEKMKEIYKETWKKIGEDYFRFSINNSSGCLESIIKTRGS